jgi:hypothetical protein
MARRKIPTHSIFNSIAHYPEQVKKSYDYIIRGEKYET